RYEPVRPVVAINQSRLRRGIAGRPRFDPELEPGLPGCELAGRVSTDASSCAPRAGIRDNDLAQRPAGVEPVTRPFDGREHRLDSAAGRNRCEDRALGAQRTY